MIGLLSNPMTYGNGYCNFYSNILVSDIAISLLIVEVFNKHIVSIQAYRSRMLILIIGGRNHKRVECNLSL